MEKSPQLNMKQVWRDMWEHPKDPHVPDYREVGENGRRYPDHFDDDRDHKVVYLIKHFGPNGEPVSAYTEMSSSNGLKQFLSKMVRRPSLSSSRIGSTSD